MPNYTDYQTVSIHAPARGATRVHDKGYRKIPVSIHAPQGGRLRTTEPSVPTSGPDDRYAFRDLATIDGHLILRKVASDLAPLPSD